MAKRPDISVAADFSGVMAFLSDRGIIPVPPHASLLDNAKRIHRATYSLILWRFRLKGLPQHSQVFIEEIASDALQILPQVMMGYSKTAKLLIRGIIENTLRHLYFSDHPIEFARMNRESKWFMTMEDLRDYPLTHPVFIETEPKFDALNRLGALYSELSAGIHGRRVQDLEMRISLKKIAYDESAVRKQVELVEKCTEAVNFVLAMFHRAKLGSVAIEDRRIILHTMAPKARQVWTHYGT